MAKVVVAINMDKMRALMLAAHLGGGPMAGWLVVGWL
jgi:hypothetical protein